MKDESDPPGSWDQNSKYILDGVGRLEKTIGELKTQLAKMELSIATADLKQLKIDVESLKEFRTQARTAGIIFGLVWPIIIIIINKFWK